MESLNFGSMDFLFNYVTLIVAAIAFIAIAIILITKRRTLSPQVKMVLVVLLILLLIYLAFILWVVIGMGNSNPAANPTPIG